MYMDLARRSPCKASSTAPHVKVQLFETALDLYSAFFQNQKKNLEELWWTDGKIPYLGGAGCVWTPRSPRKWQSGNPGQQLISAT